MVLRQKERHDRSENDSDRWSLERRGGWPHHSGDRPVDRGGVRQPRPRRRGRNLTRIARAIEADFETLWRLEAADAGKPVKQAKADIAACARYFEFYGFGREKAMEGLDHFSVTKTIAIRHG